MLRAARSAVPVYIVSGPVALPLAVLQVGRRHTEGGFSYNTVCNLNLHSSFLTQAPRPPPVQEPTAYTESELRDKGPGRRAPAFIVISGPEFQDQGLR